VTAIGIGAGLLLGASCGTRQPIRDQQVEDLDAKLSAFSWIEDGDLVTFIVDVQPTRYRAEAPYIPFQIAIANRGLKRLTLTRESFTLVDAKGNRYPVASPEELLENYNFLELDRNLGELEGVTASKFAAGVRYESNFSPTMESDIAQQAAGANLVWDRVSIPRHGYIIDFIYFPQPEAELKGQRFELFLDAPELEDPIFLKFVVK
jgi:hypothetical protein